MSDDIQSKPLAETAAPPQADTAIKPKRGRKPASKPTSEPLPVDDVSPQPDELPHPPPRARNIKNTELIVMHDCWDLLADMPTQVQRRIVTWLDAQVRENEKADEKKAQIEAQTALPK